MGTVMHAISRLRLSLGVSFLAILAFGAAQEAAANSSKISDGLALVAGRDSQDCAAPVPSQSFVSAPGVFGHPGLAGVTETPSGLASEGFAEARGASELERRADLIAALILNKYSHFRESLTSP